MKSNRAARLLCVAASLLFFIGGTLSALSIYNGATLIRWPNLPYPAQLAYVIFIGSSAGSVFLWAALFSHDVSVAPGWIQLPGPRRILGGGWWRTDEVLLLTDDPEDPRIEVLASRLAIFGESEKFRKRLALYRRIWKPGKGILYLTETTFMAILMPEHAVRRAVSHWRAETAAGETQTAYGKMPRIVG